MELLNTLLALSWRAYPAALLAAGGLWLLLRAARDLRRAHRHARDPERALAVARSLRVGILGLCVWVFAIAWLAQIGWLAVVSLIVFGQELLETSFMVRTLEDGRRLRERSSNAG